MDEDPLYELCECGLEFDSCGMGWGCLICKDSSNNTTTTTTLITVLASYILIVIFILAILLLFKSTKSDKLTNEEETV